MTSNVDAWPSTRRTQPHHTSTRNKEGTLLKGVGEGGSGGTRFTCRWDPKNQDLWKQQSGSKHLKAERQYGNNSRSGMRPTRH